MKTLFVLTSVMVILFLAAPNKIEAQKRKAAKIIEGTISNYYCGDNCYLTITDNKGKEYTGLCTAPVCTKWNENAMMPDIYKGRRVKVTVGKGRRLTGAGDVVDTMDAFTRIQLQPAPPSVSAQPKSKTPKIKTITGYYCGDGIEGQVIAHYLLRTQQGVMEFAYLFNPGVNNQWGVPTRFYGFKQKRSHEIGAEYIVKYVIGEEGPEAQSFTFTGKVKKIMPCSVE
jgi:hypothetical protein